MIRVLVALVKSIKTVMEEIFNKYKKTDTKCISFFISTYIINQLLQKVIDYIILLFLYKKIFQNYLLLKYI